MVEIPFSDLRIRVQEKGRPIFEVIKSLQVNVAKLNKTPATFLKKVFDDPDGVDAYIQQHRVRPKEKHTEEWRLAIQNNLLHTLRTGSGIFMYNNKWVLGIGEKAFLDQYAPYWYKVNDGGMIDMGPWNGVYGYWDGRVFHHTGKYKNTNPHTRGITSRSKGKKIPGKGNSILMIPMKPIPPMHYLNHMVGKLNSLIATAIEEFKSTHSK